MSFITSRKGSLLLAALLVLTLLVYLLFHLLAPRVVQSTDDAYVHADFTLVAPKVAGFVQDVLVEDNQPVKAGQLLARLDDRDFRTALAAAEADVLGAEANLANAEANLQRQQALIEQARAKVRAEQAELVFARHEQSRYQTLASKGAGSLQNAQQAQSRIDTASARLAEGQAAVDATRKQVSVLEARVGQARGDLQRMQARRDRPAWTSPTANSAPPSTARSVAANCASAPMSRRAARCWQWCPCSRPTWSAISRKPN